MRPRDVYEQILSQHVRVGGRNMSFACCCSPFCASNSCEILKLLDSLSTSSSSSNLCTCFKLLNLPFGTPQRREKNILLDLWRATAMACLVREERKKKSHLTTHPRTKQDEEEGEAQRRRIRPQLQHPFRFPLSFSLSLQSASASFSIVLSEGRFVEVYLDL